MVSNIWTVDRQTDRILIANRAYRTVLSSRAVKSDLVFGACRRQATTASSSVHATVECSVERVVLSRSATITFPGVIAVRRIGRPASVDQVRIPRCMVTLVYKVVDAVSL